MQETLERNERQQEFAALARLISHARKSASDIGSEKIANSLNVALMALLDEAGDPALPEVLLAREPREIAN